MKKFEELEENLGGNVGEIIIVGVDGEVQRTIDNNIFHNALANDVRTLIIEEYINAA